MRSIAIQVDESLFEAALQWAQEEHTTLDAEFQRWLADYARRNRAEEAMTLVRELQAKTGTGGRRFTREELNER